MKPDIIDQYIADPDFFVKVQKCKLIFCIIMIPILYLTGSFDELIGIFK